VDEYGGDPRVFGVERGVPRINGVPVPSGAQFYRDGPPRFSYEYLQDALELLEVFQQGRALPFCDNLSFKRELPQEEWHQVIQICRIFR
jgi:hypothetical protein